MVKVELSKRGEIVTKKQDARSSSHGDFVRADLSTILSFSSEPNGLRRITAHLHTIENLSSRHQHMPAMLEDVISIQTAGTTDLQGRVFERFARHRSFPGDVFIIPKGQPTEWEWTDPYEVLNLFLSPILIAVVAMEAATLDPAHVNFMARASIRDPLVYQIGLALRDELQSTGFASRLYIESLIHALVIHLLRNHAIVPYSLHEYRHGLSVPILRSVLDYIHDNLAQDLSLNDLAALTHLSVYHFARLFRRSMKHSVHQYILERRVYAAQELILMSQLTIAEIAVRVGFHDHSHLNRHFKRLLGVAPGTLLKQRKNVHHDRTNIQAIDEEHD